MMNSNFNANPFGGGMMQPGMGGFSGA